MYYFSLRGLRTRVGAQWVYVYNVDIMDIMWYGNHKEQLGDFFSPIGSAAKRPKGGKSWTFL